MSAPSKEEGARVGRTLARRDSTGCDVLVLLKVVSDVPWQLRTFPAPVVMVSPEAQPWFSHDEVIGAVAPGALDAVQLHVPLEPKVCLCGVDGGLVGPG